MDEEKDVFKVEKSVENFDTWSEKPFISEALKKTLRASSILIIPSLSFRDRTEPTFPGGTAELLEYFKEKLPSNYKIDICIDEANYYELALHSNYKRIGKFLVSTVALTVFLNILSNYIYEKVTKKDELEPQIQIINMDKSEYNINNNQSDDSEKPKKFLEPSKVKFSITVVDSNGLSKEFNYEGPAKDVENVTNQIQQLWVNAN